VTRPIASLSLDLDNEWSYLKVHGDAGWETLPSYLDVVVPRSLEVMADLDLTATWFVVGLDAAQERNGPALASISAAGHEIGNHSHRHEPWLHLYTEAELARELDQAEDAIESATGARPVGFRGPGYSLSLTTLEELGRRDYRYDASTLPTVIGPLARAYYLRSTGMDEEERQQRSHLFGTVSDGFRSLRPYRWDLPQGPLLEIPVSTMPLVRVPFHLSYVLYLAERSTRLALRYFRTALRLCRLRNVEPSILLHPLDFLGGTDIDSLAFFPGMAMPARLKIEVVTAALEILTEWHDVGTMLQHAEACDARPTPLETPRFDGATPQSHPAGST
jgi:peptidoglycan/xylan/chitin deacetylase (PgdA/CDA1 family)